MNQGKKYKDGCCRVRGKLVCWVMLLIFFAMSTFLVSSCSSGPTSDYKTLKEEYDAARETQQGGDFHRSLEGYKHCVSQCSQEQYQEDDSLKLLLPRAMGQLLNIFQSQSDQMGCVEYFDSLKREVDEKPTGYNKVLVTSFKRDVYVLLSYALSRTEDVNRAASVMDQALEMPLNYPTPERQFRDYAYASAVYYCVPDGESKVLKYGRMALDKVKFCQNKSGAQWLVVLMGEIYQRKGEVDKTISMFQEGYELAAMANDTLGMANAKREIADYLLQWNLAEMADKFASQAVRLVESIHNANPMVQTCIYATKASALIAQHNNTKALYYLRKAKSCSAGLPYNSGVSDVDRLLGSILVGKSASSSPDDYDKGMKLLQFASQEATPKIRALAFWNMAHAHILEGKKQEGENELDSVYVLTQNASVPLCLFDNAFSYAAQYYRQQGNLAKASLYDDVLQKIKLDQTASVKNVVKSIAKLEMQEKEMKLNEKQREISKRRVLIGTLIVVLVVLLLLSSVGFVWQRRKTKRTLAPVEKLNDEVLLLGVLREEGLESFRLAFDKAHPSFVKLLRTKIPNITEREELYARVMALGVSNVELADIFQVARSSIVVAKYRLRKKITLAENQSLEDYIVTIYISTHPLNRLYLKAIHEMLKIKKDWI